MHDIHHPPYLHHSERLIQTEGTVLSITYPGAGQTPLVRVTLQRETDMLTLIFQSRTTLEALDIGQLVQVRGAVVMHESEPTIFNPDYTIKGISDEYYCSPTRLY